MRRQEKDIEQSLLDWHLDRLGADDRSWVEEALRRDARLREKSERLGKILHPLDYWRIAAAPPNLADKVVAYVERSASQGGKPQPPPVESARFGRFPFASLRELIAVAACIILLVGVLVPVVSELRSRSRRTLCAANLGSIFRGTATYRQEFGGSLPFAGSLAGAAWLPSGARGRPYASNSRHVYLLVRQNCGPTPADFICPAAKSHKPMPEGDWEGYDDFPAACNISYATLNLAGPTPNLRPTIPVAYISDANPLFIGARFNAAIDPDRANSPAHRGKGQTVLTLDGSASWMTKPVYGPKSDNLWLIGRIRRYTGIETPTGDDVQLLPGYPATDPAVSRMLRLR